MPIFSHYWAKPEGGADPEKLKVSGPVLQVEIAVHTTHAEFLNKSQIELPNPFHGNGLIDTGASSTCVEEKVLIDLGIPIIDKADIWTPHGDSPHNIYPCKISFPGSPIPPLDFNSVIGSNLKGFGCVALIGRDILRHFQLVYNGVEGSWTLAF